MSEVLCFGIWCIGVRGDWTFLHESTIFVGISRTSLIWRAVTQNLNSEIQT